MFLKALEMQGFKSFADKTVIQLDGSITAIVGPNGSGKSNISDAIRWVLGEQSTKSLRGSKMEDVIFGGTQKRSQLGYAEASLIFDNSDASLAYDAGEVMVTRRYYRSGESEYFINRQQARLRDLLELFMDTGIGREGYSNIGQGKIDEILSVKSTDRREIFEEAAGISKYRHRKEETERKLETTEDNLLRIGDKISELELQLNPLKEQAEKAEKYLTLKGELSGTEIAVWLDSLGKISVNTKKADEDYLSASFILGQEKENEEKLYAKEDSLAADLLSCDEKIENHRQELSSKKEDLQQTLSELQQCENEISNRKGNILRITEDMSNQSSLSESVQKQIAEAEETVSALDGEIAEITAAFEKAEFSAKDAYDSGNAGREKLFGLQKELSLLSESLAKNGADSQNAEEQLAEKNELFSHLSEECEKSESKLSELRENRKSEETKLAEEEELAQSARNSISGYLLRAEQAEKKRLDIQGQLQHLEVQHRTSQNKLSILEAMQRDMDGFHKSVKLVMQEAKKGALRGIHGPVTSLIRTESEYALAVETALGSSQQSIIVDSEQNGKAAMLYLKSAAAGRATFLPISVMKGNLLKESALGDCLGFVGLASDLIHYDSKYEGIMLNLLGRTVIAEDIDYALQIAKRFSNRFKIVTLDGQVLNPGGSMTGGSAASGSGMLSRANEIDRLRKELSDSEEKLAALQTQLTDLTQKHEKVTYEIEVLQGELRLHEDNILRMKNNISGLLALEETVESVRTDDAAQAESVKEQIHQLELSRKALAEEFSNMTAQKGKLEKNLSEMSSLLEEANEEIQKFEAQLSDLRERKASCESAKSSAKTSIENYQRILKEISEDCLKKEDVISQYQSEIQSYEESREEILSREKIRRDVISRLELDLQVLLKDRSDLDNRRTVTSRSARELTQKIASLEAEVYRLEQKKTNLEQEEAGIIEKLWDNYSLTPGTAAEKAAPIESIPAANKRISELKRKISSLGTPNLGAIEEYNRVNERYSYLTGQRDDVESAKAELLSVLRTITKEMTVIFTSEFEKINRYFSETFVEMFHGGKAALLLENPEEPLDCGIEIKVQPPGKQVKTITLLSGGEKAFVAIALYFAILKVRPTPFCMLDEIDAALDDQNVERFARYLRSLSKNTQFIVITHRRGTMEEADTLYGVTMQEQGISKMLHLNLDALSRQLGIEAN